MKVCIVNSRIIDSLRVIGLFLWVLLFQQLTCPSFLNVWRFIILHANWGDIHNRAQRFHFIPIKLKLSGPLQIVAVERTQGNVQKRAIDALSLLAKSPYSWNFRNCMWHNYLNYNITSLLLFFCSKQDKQWSGDVA